MDTIYRVCTGFYNGVCIYNKGICMVVFQVISC